MQYRVLSLIDQYHTLDQIDSLDFKKGNCLYDNYLAYDQNI